VLHSVCLSEIQRDTEADTTATQADLSIFFASDRFSEGADNNIGLLLPGDQNSVIAQKSKKTIVILNTVFATVLMPWLEEVDAVMESWYSGQQVGLLFGDVNPSGKLLLTFPKHLNDTIQITGSLRLSSRKV